MTTAQEWLEYATKTQADASKLDALVSTSQEWMARYDMRMHAVRLTRSLIQDIQEDAQKELSSDISLELKLNILRLRVDLMDLAD